MYLLVVFLTINAKKLTKQQRETKGQNMIPNTVSLAATIDPCNLDPEIPFKKFTHSLLRSHNQEEKTEAQLQQTSAATHHKSLYCNYHNKDCVKLEIALLI